MKKNMGNTDKVIRLLIALVIVVLHFANVLTGTWAIILYIVAAVLILTSILGICPAYLPFGISTLKKEEKK